MSASAPATTEWPRVRSLLSPLSVLLAVYVVYFAILYTPIYELVYWELMNLGTRIIGFRPTVQTLMLYIYGGVVLITGATIGASVARRIDARRTVEAFGGLIAGVRGWCTDGPLGKAGIGFWLSLAGWAVGLAANATQVAASGGASLFDIASRWQQSPILVWFAASQIFFVPALMVSAKGKLAKTVGGLAFVVSLLALSMLGARNLPAKLLVSAFLALAYVVRTKDLWRMAVTFVVLLALALGFIGAVTKSGIYGPRSSAELAIALGYSDSVGTAYNLDRIVNTTPSTGVYDGRLLGDSAKALIPGVSAEYANFQLGKYLVGRSSFEIDGVLIERSVSLAPTLLGAPYADWGVPGVVGQMLFLGALFGYMGIRSRSRLWIIPFLVTMASYVVNGVNAGVHNPHAIAALGAAASVIILDMTIADRLLGAPARTSEV